MNERAKTILDFWFTQSTMEDWFKKDDIYDQKIKKLFLGDLKKAINNEYDEWQDTAEECVALVILLDQFSRNLFRNHFRNNLSKCGIRIHGYIRNCHNVSYPVIFRIIFRIMLGNVCFCYYSNKFIIF